MEIKDFNQLISSLEGRPKATVVLAGAHDAHALEAVCQASAAGKIDYLLVGRPQAIEETAKSEKLELDFSRVLAADSDEQCAVLAVRTVMEAPGRFLMKGGLMTATLMKAAVSRENGLRGDSILSHVALIENPLYPKLIAVSDGGMIPHPDFEQKKAIAENAVSFLLSLGYDKPKLAFLAAVEVENPAMPETAEAARLADYFNQSGRCVAAGPLSLDLAVSAESAAIKKYQGPVAGQADILVAPEITAGNILSKSMIYFGGSAMAGCVVGARRPIVLTSRGASAKEKYLSLVLAAAACA